MSNPRFVKGRTMLMLQTSQSSQVAGLIVLSVAVAVGPWFPDGPLRKRWTVVVVPGRQVGSGVGARLRKNAKRPYSVSRFTLVSSLPPPPPPSPPSSAPALASLGTALP